MFAQATTQRPAYVGCITSGQSRCISGKKGRNSGEAPSQCHNYVGHRGPGASGSGTEGEDGSQEATGKGQAIPPPVARKSAQTWTGRRWPLLLPFPLLWGAFIHRKQSCGVSRATAPAKEQRRGPEARPPPRRREAAGSASTRLRELDEAMERLGSPAAVDRAPPLSEAPQPQDGPSCRGKGAPS